MCGHRKTCHGGAETQAGGSPALLPLPTTTRFEQREEYERAQTWRARFAVELAPFLDLWKPREADLLKLIDRAFSLLGVALAP